MLWGIPDMKPATPWTPELGLRILFLSLRHYHARSPSFVVEVHKAGLWALFPLSSSFRERCFVRVSLQLFLFSPDLLLPLF